MASEAGKGSRPRPFNVTQEQYDARWELIFGRDKPEEANVPSTENDVGNVKDSDQGG